jgi:hypothetical protein
MPAIWTEGHGEPERPKTLVEGREMSDKGTGAVSDDPSANHAANGALANRQLAGSFCESRRGVSNP